MVADRMNGFAGLTGRGRVGHQLQHKREAGFQERPIAGAWIAAGMARVRQQ